MTITTLERRHALLAAWLVAAMIAPAARAEIFTLHDGGQVRGELVNRDQSPRKNYVIKTSSGGQITLDAAQVKEVKRQTAADQKYDRQRVNYPDTPEGQWKLAEWCRENRMPTQRKTHLERVIALDPEHGQARRALGYVQDNGRWIQQDALMAENGYVRYHGQWVLEQEMEILEQQRKEQLAQKEWAAKLKRWHAWLATDKSELAVQNIRAINDPFAVKALIKYLGSDANRDARMMYVEVLGKINTPAAMDALVESSVNDADEEIRLACLDQVVTHKYKGATGQYVKGLKSKDNATINRSALCLGQLKDQSAIPPLIDALVTNHTFTIQHGSPGGTGAAFGRGPGGTFGGITAGSSIETINQRIENRNVLQALVEMSGGVNFNYDIRAWRYWYAAQKKPQSLARGATTRASS